MRKLDIDAILASVETTKSPGALDRWLAEDPHRTELFWDLIERGQRMGKSIDRLIRAWNEASDGLDRCPVKHNQVRLALRERESQRARQNAR